MISFAELLATGPVICDGAVGTQLYAVSGRMDHCLDYLNLTEPAMVGAVHRAYIQAGAQIIETNTFGANSVRLSGHDLSTEAREINLAGARLAREQAGEHALVAGSIGPTGKLLEPYGVLSTLQAERAFAEQADALKDGGVDVIFVETMADLKEAAAAVGAAKSTGLPVVAMMSFAQEGRTMMGVDPKAAVTALEALEVDAVGANCGTGLHDMLGIVTEMLKVATKPVIAQPNAGFPQFVDGRMVYVTGQSYFADYARQFAELGVSIIGGCCGTTPEHIKSIVEALRGSAYGA